MMDPLLVFKPLFVDPHAVLSFEFLQRHTRHHVNLGRTQMCFQPLACRYSALY